MQYAETSSVAACQHLSNTVLVDRIIICVPVPEGLYDSLCICYSLKDLIPDEETALKTGGPSMPGQRQLPPSVVNQVSYVEGQQVCIDSRCICTHSQVILTIDSRLSALGLPPYPPLPANTDAGKVEEIRRTIYVGNLPKDVEPQQLMEFFTAYIGEVIKLI